MRATKNCCTLARRSTWALAAALIGLLVARCGTLATGAGSGDVSGQTPGTAQRAADLLIVDCYLPPQIRQIGGKTYVTPPRGVKTSAADCQIRGGDYAAYDRADYKTALKVWMPLAKDGDVSAQVHVGEIFEKGLGVPPDYALAAEWYRRAAKAGSSRAAVNLGALYEQGLGVPRDPAQAIAWYRTAGGISDLKFEVAAPNTSTTSTTVTDQLRKELEETRRKLNVKQEELSRTQHELDRLRRSVEDRRGAADVDRAELARLRTELEARRKKEQGGSTRIRELEQAVAERENRVSAKDGEIAKLREMLARREAELKAQRSEVDKLAPQTVDGAPTIQLIEPDLVLTRDIQAVGLVRTTTDRLAIVGRVVASAGVHAFTVNGREHRLESGNLFKTEIPVRKREEKVRVAVVDRAGRKAALDFVIARSGDAEPDRAGGDGVASAGPRREVVGFRPTTRLSFGTYHALVVGNDDYRDLPKLKTAVRDAREVAAVLQKEYGFRVTVLVNANRYQMLKALNDMRSTLTEKDNLLIYYAGHGQLDEKNQRGHWLPVDAEPHSSANWISNVQISDQLHAMTVRQLLVVADSCYAGTMTRSALARLDGGASEQERFRVVKLMGQQRSRMVMTSGGVEPVIDNTGGPHSVFAQTFIELLRKNVGVLPGQDLFQLLRVRVAASAVEYDMRQVPEYAPIKLAGHESGDFVFVRPN